MSASLTFDQRALPLPKANSPALKHENNSAVAGIAVGIALGLPLWAAIGAIGEMVLKGL